MCIWITTLVNSFTRFAASMLGGVWVGSRIVQRISVEKFRLTVYLFLAAAGVITLIQSLI